MMSASSDEAVQFLRIPGDSSLQAVHENPASPPLLHRVLSFALSWEHRVELTTGQLLLSPGLAPSVMAALLVLETRAAGANDDNDHLLADLLPRTQSYQGAFDHLIIPMVSHQVWGEAHIARMPGDTPSMGAAAVVELDGERVHKAHVSLTGVWPEAARLATSAHDLVGGPLDDDQINRVAEAVRQEVEPQGDHLASAAYRREMAAVLTRRVLNQCQEGVNQG
jgi:CO/xanthine dehydrogenase FAD-binding subunit